MSKKMKRQKVFLEKDNWDLNEDPTLITEEWDKIIRGDLDPDDSISFGNKKNKKKKKKSETETLIDNVINRGYRKDKTPCGYEEATGVTINELASSKTGNELADEEFLDNRYMTNSLGFIQLDNWITPITINARNHEDYKCSIDSDDLDRLDILSNAVIYSLPPNAIFTHSDLKTKYKKLFSLTNFDTDRFNFVYDNATDSVSVYLVCPESEVEIYNSLKERNFNDSEIFMMYMSLYVKLSMNYLNFDSEIYKDYIDSDLNCRDAIYKMIVTDKSSEFCDSKKNVLTNIFKKKYIEFADTMVEKYIDFGSNYEDEDEDDEIELTLEEINNLKEESIEEDDDYEDDIITIEDADEIVFPEQEKPINLNQNPVTTKLEKKEQEVKIISTSNDDDSFKIPVIRKG